MHDWQSQSHVKWDCTFHVVFIPKYRQNVFYGKMRRKVGQILRQLCQQKGVELLEGPAMPDHMHVCLSVPPKYRIAHTIGFLKGKSAVKIHRELLNNTRMTGLHFWARGYCVSPVGYDEAAVRQYIREQERQDKNQSACDFDG
jgi:putative transposase